MKVAVIRVLIFMVFPCLVSIPVMGQSLSMSLTSLNPMQATVQRYVISSDGSEVTDQQTDLVWRRCSEGTYWDGAACSVVGTDTFTYDEAVQRATDQAAMTGLGWRLPQYPELESIVDMDANLDLVDGLKLAATDLKLFPQTPASWFWTGSPASENPDNIADIDFYDGLSGQISGSVKSERYYVRLVRAVIN